MLRYRVSTTIAVAAAACLTTATAAPAMATGGRPPEIVHFDLAAHQQPENITIEPDGSADLTFAGIAQVARVSTTGQVSVIANLPAGGGVSGIVRAPDGTLYVNYQGGAETGVWQIDRSGKARLFAALPAGGSLNGLAISADVLYATDSSAGQVWRIPLDGSGAVLWAQGGALAKTSAYGANGIKADRSGVWVSNTDAGKLLRIPVNRDGSAGPVQVKATGLAGIDDFALDGPTVLAALDASSVVVRVRPDGSHSVVLTGDDGLSNPTSVAVRGRMVYVPSAAYATQHDPNLLIVRSHD